MEQSLTVAGLPARNSSRKSTGCAPQPLSFTWDKHLPREWREAIEDPLYFAQYSEYEMVANRAVGYDADDLPCFTSHRFQLTRLASDDDEEFYELVTYSEEMAAWRLRDERWLIFRLIATNNCGEPRGFYLFSPEMPR